MSALVYTLLDTKWP